MPPWSVPAEAWRLLAEPGRVADLPDSAQIAAALYRGSEDRLARTLFGARHTQHLIGLGHSDDVAFAARIDASDALPVFRDNQLVLDGR